jgi:hypothetical protein
MKRPDDPGIRALRRDFDDAMQFTHVMAMQVKDDTINLLAMVSVLVEDLVEQDLIAPERLVRRIEDRRKQEIEAQAQRAFVQFYPDVDKYTLTGLPDVPCAELIPLCQARCCKLHAPLSRQDLDERLVSVDWMAPYHLLRGRDGYCAHSDSESRSCTVYANRPATCRTYDCRHDPRIWADFDKRILADDARAGRPSVAAPSDEG